jgi:hypothetical protein
MGEDGRAVALDVLIESNAGTGRGDQTQTRTLGLFTGRPVGFLELYPFLPDGAHFVPGKQTLIFDVCNAIG